MFYNKRSNYCLVQRTRSHLSIECTHHASNKCNVSCSDRKVEGLDDNVTDRQVVSPQCPQSHPMLVGPDLPQEVTHTLAQVLQGNGGDINIVSDQTEYYYNSLNANIYFCVTVNNVLTHVQIGN